MLALQHRLPIAAPVFLLGAALVAAAGCVPANSADNTLFEKGRDRVRAGDYEAALAPLTRFQEEQPRAKLASNAGLYLGKAYLALGRLDEARTAWRNTVERYPASLEGHKCRYKLGMLAFLEGNSTEALERFTALAESPDGPLAPEALAFKRFIEQGQDRLIPIEASE